MSSAKRLQGISFIFDLSGCLRSCLPELLEICFDLRQADEVPLVQNWKPENPPG